MSIRAIETLYASCRFRSRTEARWAVFFDSLGVKWDYEVEGFVLPNGEWYLPDFRLRHHHTGEIWWVEIKGTAPTANELSKFESLISGAECAGGSLYVGLPHFDWPNSSEIVDYSRFKTSRGSLDRCDFATCDSFYLVLDDFCKAPRWATGESPFKAAIRSAKSARFEFGEQPSA